MIGGRLFWRVVLDVVVVVVVAETTGVETAEAYVGVAGGVEVTVGERRGRLAR